MKFKTLTIHGFGPFAGTETIDFALLGTAGLFLLSGPTGAGKTTLLDAISYALFAQTTGQGQGSGVLDGRSGAELRCTRSTPEQKTEVELIFTVGGRDYKVVRNPKYPRPARRSNKVVDELACAALYLWTPGEGGAIDRWQLRAEKVIETTAEIERITGFTAEQFRRVIVIPQGRFRDVLISSAEDREDLLKRIFGTAVFERFEELVKEGSQTTQALLRQAQQERQALFINQEWASLIVNDRELAEEIVQRLTQAGVAAQAARQLLTEVSRRYDDLNNKLGEVREIARLARAVTEAAARQQTADAALETLQPDRRVLDDARAAAEPARLRAEWRSLEKELATKSLEAAGLAAEALAALADVSTKALARDQAIHSDKTAQIDTRLGEIAAVLSEAASAETRFAELRVDAAAAETLETAAQAHEAAEAVALAVAQRALAEADETLDVSRQQYQAGTAARLAATLKSDQACPVCGSIDHPAITTSSADIPTDEAMKKRTQQQLAATHLFTTALAALGEARMKNAAAVASATAARSALSSMPQPPDTAALKAEQVTLKTSRSTLSQALTAAQKALDAAIAAEGQKKMSAVAASATQQHLFQKVGHAKTLFDSSLSASRFDSEEGVVAAARDAATIESLSATIAAADQEAALACEVLFKTRESLGGRTGSDEPELTAVHATLTLEQGQAREADELARRQLEHLSKFKVDHEAIAKRCTAADESFQSASALHQMVSGQGHSQEKLSLHRWVLGTVLEGVVAEATTLLRQMTQGRYELLRAAGSGHKSSLAGLDIDVVDTWSGTTRSVRTLSGGETFLASLAFSLALARTTEQHQGGRRLETVFIDEGFGSLDAQTLEYAMATLKSLRDEGRIVGVISHVEEMQRAIPVQLRIIGRDETITTQIVGI